MLKKSKIIAMTKLAIYEKHKGEEALEITKYYREDYISNRILQGVIRYFHSLAFHVFVDAGRGTAL